MSDHLKEDEFTESLTRSSVVDVEGAAPCVFEWQRADAGPPPAARRTMRAQREAADVTFQESLELVVKGFEVLGVGILVAGAIAALAGYARDVRQMDRTRAYVRLRGNIGRTILLGLEVLIVADIVLTVAINSTVESAITLGVIVLVRTFLSFSLEIELEGVVPWHRRAIGAPISGSDDPVPRS